LDYPANEARLSVDEIHDLTLAILKAHGVSEAQARAITGTILAAERDDCRSHGVYRLLGYVRSVKSGKANATAMPELSQPTQTIIRVDAKRGFAPLANETGRPALIAAARQYGLAALAINNCYHFSALWADLEPIADAGLVAIGLTAGQCTVAPHGGSRPIFGTNPFAFAWPRPDQPAFVFDFATSAIARGEIELHRRADKSIPLGWAIDEHGQPTTDPVAALAGAMLPFGGYKGTALALMIELLAGPLIGDLTSAESMKEDNGAGSPPLGGELIIAFDPARFAGGQAVEHMQRAEALFADLKSQDGVRLPGDRRLAARTRSAKDGILVPKPLLKELRELLAEVRT
jgi:delta1-piperideine-2-carboxylate reductase